MSDGSLSPLVYPAGIMPGFNPLHPALKGVSHGFGFSAVVSATGIVDVLSGLPGVVTGTPAFGIDSHIGPCLNFSTTGMHINFSGKSITRNRFFTFAAMIRPTTITGYRAYFHTSSANDGLWFGLINGPVGGSAPGLADAPGAFSLVASVPYFCCASFDTNTATINTIAVDLRTGKITSGTATQAAFNPSAPSGTYRVGLDAAATSSAVAKIAAVSFAPTFLTIPELLKCSNDPWSIWYPK